MPDEVWEPWPKLEADEALSEFADVELVGVSGCVGEELAADFCALSTVAVEYCSDVCAEAVFWGSWIGDALVLGCFVLNLPATPAGSSPFDNAVARFPGVLGLLTANASTDGTETAELESAPLSASSPRTGHRYRHRRWGMPMLFAVGQDCLNSN